MTESTAESRRAFYSFLEQLRLQTFSMYEALREVEKAPDGEMDRRMAKLGEVGSTAAGIFAEIEQLFAAVWHESDQTAVPNFQTTAVRERALAGVR